MDPKKTELKRKTDAIKVFIEKQVGNGVKPKDVYQQLTAKNVPSELAAELINQVLAKEDSTPESDSETAVQFTERQQKIINFVRGQLRAGKSKKEILNILVEKKVSKDEAVDLIRHVTPKPSQKAESSLVQAGVSPLLPTEPFSRAASQAKSPLDFVAEQRSAGADLKRIVDQLVEGGMERNKAIDVVVRFDQKQSLELAGPTAAELSSLAVRGRNKMLMGIAALVGGGLITAASYAASEPGEEYFFFYGPMIFGAIYAVAGLVEWLRNL